MLSEAISSLSFPFSIMLTALTVCRGSSLSNVTTEQSKSAVALLALRRDLKYYH